MILISTTTKRDETKGIYEITFVLEGVAPEIEAVMPGINRERSQLVELLGWDNYHETLCKVVGQPNGRVHVHFVYQRRS